MSDYKIHGDILYASRKHNYATSFDAKLHLYYIYLKESNLYKNDLCINVSFFFSVLFVVFHR